MPIVKPQLGFVSQWRHSDGRLGSTNSRVADERILYSEASAAWQFRFFSLTCSLPSCLDLISLVYFMYVSVFPACVLHVSPVLKEVRRDHLIPQNWSYRWSWVTVWVLGTEPRVSARAASSLHWWGSPQSLWSFLMLTQTCAVTGLRSLYRKDK